MKPQKKNKKTPAPTTIPTPAPEQTSACADFQEIADRAYAIWIEQGCPDGQDMEHWIEAESHFMKCRTDEEERGKVPTNQRGE